MAPSAGDLALASTPLWVGATVSTRRLYMSECAVAYRLDLPAPHM